MDLLPLYLKGAIHLLMILHNLYVTNETILASIDVEALYLSIPRKILLTIISSFLHEISMSCEECNTFILDIIQFVFNIQCVPYQWLPLPPGTGCGDGDYVCPIVGKPVPGGLERYLFAYNNMIE